MNNTKAIEELETLKRFIQDLHADIENIHLGDFAMGLYNWSGDSVEALDLAIKNLKSS